MIHSIEDINSIAKDMKYEALYWALGYCEYEQGIFVKEYQNKFQVKIYVNNGVVDFNSKISIVKQKYLILNNHKSFVILECVDKLLSMGYKPSEIIIDLDNEFDIYCDNLYIKCYDWLNYQNDSIRLNIRYVKSISYTSRLISGVIERKYVVKENDGNKYTLGIFENENRKEEYVLSNPTEITSSDFDIKGTLVINYHGNEKKVIIPDGITDLAACLFWDNQIIEEVILPTSLVNIGGDTFYNCSNLKKVNIPKNLQFMGDNPFAGCPNVKIINESPYFNYIDNVLYNQDYTKLIYCSINKPEEEYCIKDTTKIIGKHSFYLCKNLKKITIPSSVIKLGNNPFSGCEQLELENHSNYYHIIDKVVYNRDKKSVIGCLNSIHTDELKLLDVEKICRNSFWNCKGIKKIILPKTLKKIGYNPFVGCSNIEFESHSSEYIVYNNALYTKDKSTLVCYPTKFAVGDVYLPDETTILERGAFSGAYNLKNIHLHNVSIISKSAFTNCNSLENVYCSDIVSFIGEWAFAHCEKLKTISVHQKCYLDKNVISNTNAKIIRRNYYSNYVIQSDNIYTLESMYHNYVNRIKSIIIDPPYNSKVDYIGYKDEFDYKEFMTKRIKQAAYLLSVDGFLVINIDEGELTELQNICYKYFINVRVCKWEKIHPYFDANRNVSPDKKVVKYEYILICSCLYDAKLNKIKQPYIEDNVLKEKESEVPDIFSCFGTTSSAKDEIKEIFGSRDYFSTPKPVKLIKELIRATTDKDSIVLDFFAGSGTVGQAVVELNKEENSNRKYILISNDESNICQEVTLKRMKKFDKDVIFLS